MTIPPFTGTQEDHPLAQQKRTTGQLHSNCHRIYGPSGSNVARLLQCGCRVPPASPERCVSENECPEMIQVSCSCGPAVQVTFKPVHQPPELSIIVPTFNETANVHLVIDALDRSLPSISWEVIFVDDDSPDGTADRVRGFANRDARVRCIRRVRRRGLAGAAIEGMLSSSAPVVVIMDGDLQHDESLLPEMLQRILSGDDLVIASRFCDVPGAVGGAADGLSSTRLAGSRLATRMARTLLSIDVSDPMSGFFAMRRPAFEALAPRLSTQGFKILMDILASTPVPLRTSEMPFHFRQRQHGTSKLDNLVAVEYFGLLLAKLTGDFLSLRFLLFSLIGGIGVIVHLMTLKAALACDLPFWLAQMTAAYIAMTGNFFLNNALTYRDRRLKGSRLMFGLASFYVVCSIGVIANVGIGQLLHDQASRWWLAGLAGACLGAVFNYAITSAFTWRIR